MIVSIFLFLQEIRLSNQALKISFERYGFNEKKIYNFIFSQRFFLNSDMPLFNLCL